MGNQISGMQKKKKPIQGTDTHFFKADILTGKSHLAYMHETQQSKKSI